MSKERKGTSFHNMSQKEQKLTTKNDFWYFKVQVSKLTRTENFKNVGFFVTNRSVGAKPQKRCGNIIADSETFKRYGDFDT